MEPGSFGSIHSATCVNGEQQQALMLSHILFPALFVWLSSREAIVSSRYSKVCRPFSKAIGVVGMGNATVKRQMVTGDAQRQI